MPKHQVSDPITDQEIAFAHLVLSGTMTDRRAAEAVGLNPDTAAYTKAKPRVRAYMLEHRAAMHQQLVQQETERLRRLNLGREQVLARLWEIANLSADMTRGSITGQVTVISMMVAMENFIPTVAPSTVSPSLRRRNPPQRLPTRKSIPPLGFAGISPQPSTPQPTPTPAQQEDSPACPACLGRPWRPWGITEPAPGSAGAAPPDPAPGHSTLTKHLTPAEALPLDVPPIHFYSRHGSFSPAKEPLCPPPAKLTIAKGPKNIEFYK